MRFSFGRHLYALILSASLIWVLPVELFGTTSPTRGHCLNVSVKEWEQKSKIWRGATLMAFASWCSSCKESLMAAKKAPEKFIFFSVFEDPKHSEEALMRLGLSSPCIYGEDLAEKLGVKDLPWSTKI